MLEVPLILVGSGYWKGLLQWMKEIMMDTENNISPADFDMLKVADNAAEVAEHIKLFYTKHSLQPNF